MTWPIRYVAGAAKKGWAAWREQRLDLSPLLVAAHLRNYYRELRGGPVSSIPAPPSVAVRSVSPYFSTTGRRCLLMRATPWDESWPTAGDFLTIGHGVTVFDAASDRLPEPSPLDTRVKVIATSDDLRTHLAVDGLSYDWVVLFDVTVGASHLMTLRALAPRACLIYRRPPGAGASPLRLEAVDPRETYCLRGADRVIADDDRCIAEVRALAPSAPVSIVDFAQRADHLHALFPPDRTTHV